MGNNPPELQISVLNCILSLANYYRGTSNASLLAESTINRFMKHQCQICHFWHESCNY